VNTDSELRSGRRALQAGPEPSIQGYGRNSGDSQISVRVLSITLALSLWVASGSLVLAITEGLGPDPLRRLLIGVLLVLCIAAALWQRSAVCAALRARPWLVVPIAVALLCVAVADGVIGGPYVAITLTSIGLAAVVARPRTVWLCVAVLDAGYAAAILIDSSPAALVQSGQLAGVLGALLGYPFVALVVLGLAGLFRRFVGSTDAVLDTIRDGSPALTPALTHAVRLGAGSPLALLTAPSPFIDLTSAEVRVVEGLASGSRPKQLAYAWGVSLALVRKHIRHAKRKTGASTLPELAAMTARPDWPKVQRP